VLVFSNRVYFAGFSCFLKAGGGTAPRCAQNLGKCAGHHLDAGKSEASVETPCRHVFKMSNVLTETKNYLINVVTFAKGINELNVA
jgi:hypothetical protein